jgi:transketolase
MLAVDQVEKAKSGHPGMPLGAAPMAYVLWTMHMRYNPYNPKWHNRDRFVLSAGHGSALLYAMLHLSGYDLSLDELKNFRQFDSQTPGHPEYWCAPGVEVTTGPLGQGFGMGVGMAIAERYLSSRFKKDGFSPLDHYTYAIVSDGDLMEGVASEAASIAGHLKLGKLIYLYDDNHISIEGDTDITFTENACKRFEAYGWHVQRVEDGNHLGTIDDAITNAQKELHKPSIIAIRTHIGFGSPRQDNAKVHGEPLGEDAAKKTKEFFGWPADKSFYVPDEVRAQFLSAVERGRKSEDEWNGMFREYNKMYPNEAKELERAMDGYLPMGWDHDMEAFPADKPMATRESSGKIINEIAPKLPDLIGGSADLAPSCKTLIDDGGDVGPEDNAARNLHFGVREHAMGTIVNGMAMHGGLIPYGSTFLIFSDYMKPAIRLAGLMKAHSIFVFTHDSIGLGEDGPTHQPIEQLMSLRAIPNLTVIRPADANETAEAWRIAVERRGPTALALTRQKVPTFDVNKYPVNGGVKRGAYVLSDCEGRPDIILIATGSEVHLALEAKEKITRNVRVVSMPSWEIFEEQEEEYRDGVLPPNVKARMAIEAGVTLGWQKWVGIEGEVIGVDQFGASAPAGVLMEKYGFGVEKIVEKAREVLEQD